MKKNLKNIAPIGIALQSSLTKWSHGRNEALNALTGLAPKGYSFHTNNGPDEWILIDLHECYLIDCIYLYKRKDFENFYNPGDLHVSVSTDFINWDKSRIPDNHSKVAFSLSYNNQKIRFIKITTHNKYLFFSKIEILSDDNLMIFRDFVLFKSPLISDLILKSIKKGSYEIDEINIVLEKGCDDDTFLELGGSIGAMSICAKNKFPDSKYICFEANPHLIDIIAANQELNNIHTWIVNAAVGKANKTTNFYISANIWASSLGYLKNATEVAKIDLVAFNDLVDGIKPSFLICDIEGGEYQIFDDSLNLSSINKICIEIHPEKDLKNIKLYDYFIARGFKSLQPRPASSSGGVYFFSR